MKDCTHETKIRKIEVVVTIIFFISSIVCVRNDVRWLSTNMLLEHYLS